jgi:hypothetical protein
VRRRPRCQIILDRRPRPDRVCASWQQRDPVTKVRTGHARPRDLEPGAAALEARGVDSEAYRGVGEGARAGGGDVDVLERVVALAVGPLLAAGSWMLLLVVMRIVVFADQVGGAASEGGRGRESGCGGGGERQEEASRAAAAADRRPRWRHRPRGLDICGARLALVRLWASLGVGCEGRPGRNASTARRYAGGVVVVKADMVEGVLESARYRCMMWITLCLSQLCAI